MKEEINLVKIMEIILKLWWIVLIFAVIVGLVAFSISSFLMTPQYESVAKVYVDGSQRTAGSGINMSELTTNARLLSTYVEILCSDTYLNSIANKAKNKYPELEDLTGAEIRSRITMNAANETEILEIHYSDISPERARDILQLILNNAQSEITRIISGCKLNIVDNATLPATTSEPNIKQNTFIGIFLGIIIGVALILIRELLDTRIKGEDDLKDRYNISILGVIPNLDIE